AITITQPGYVYIYLSNESPTLVDVFFDDFKVTHTKSPVIQAEEYYPFGLVFNSYSRENSVAQDFKFQGQEHQDELGLNWDSFKWRNHQPEIGRFFNVDPLAEKYYYNSPYAFSENHVTSHVELEGLEKVDINALRSSQVREKIKAVNENGRNVIQFSGGAQVAGAGGSLKLGPLSGGGQIQLGAVQGSIKAPGNVEARGALLVASGEASAFGASASGNVALGKASVNVNPDGAGEVIINDGSANGSVSIPSFDSFGPPDRISTGIKDENGSQTASASSNGDVAVKVVLGNAWGEVRANLNAALEVTSNLVGAIGAYVGQVIENIKNPVSSEDQRIIKN
ncbi:MAG: RHS repeat domain-containing protein, partial [Cyclobacteriaceae bacterium]